MITSALPTNWSTALNGKVAGLSVISSGGPLNSSRISLRGDVSLNQNGNDALVVVDGVPMSSPMTNPGVAYGAGSNSELPWTMVTDSPTSIRMISKASKY